MVEYEPPKHEEKPDKKREELKGKVISLKDLVS